MGLYDRFSSPPSRLDLFETYLFALLCFSSFRLFILGGRYRHGLLFH